MLANCPGNFRMSVPDNACSIRARAIDEFSPFAVIYERSFASDNIDGLPCEELGKVGVLDPLDL